MKNSIIYNFEDFTHKHYKEILLLAKDKFKFAFYSDNLFQDNLILWRHDIDHSLEEALNLAKIEFEFGVKSTFFVLLHSEFYSPLEKRSTEIILEILSLGHNLGLHFDTHYYSLNSENELESKLLLEKHFLEHVFQTTIEVFSFHNTTDFTMSCKAWSYGGLINTYSDFFQSNTKYCSDSNGYWRHKRMWDFLNEEHDKPLQILTHPEWWTSKVQSPKEKIETGILERAEQARSLYEAKLSLFGRENIDW